MLKTLIVLFDTKFDPIKRTTSGSQSDRAIYQLIEPGLYSITTYKPGGPVDGIKHPQPIGLKGLEKLYGISGDFESAGEVRTIDMDLDRGLMDCAIYKNTRTGVFGINYGLTFLLQDLKVEYNAALRSLYDIFEMCYDPFEEGKPSLNRLGTIFDRDWIIVEENS